MFIQFYLFKSSFHVSRLIKLNKSKIYKFYSLLKVKIQINHLNGILISILSMNTFIFVTKLS